MNTALPAISGSTVQNQTLTSANGTWSGAVAAYGYQWKRCDSSGNGCLNIGGATGQSYLLQAADVGTTLRVVVTASNAGGAFGTATSARTAQVTAPGSNQLVIGRAAIGSLSALGGANYLDASGPYQLPTSATMTTMRAYVRGGGSGANPIRLVIYADDGTGNPGAFAAVTSEVSVPANQAAGWVDFPFASQVTLPPGKLLARLLVRLLLRDRVLRRHRRGRALRPGGLLGGRQSARRASATRGHRTAHTRSTRPTRRLRVSPRIPACRHLGKRDPGRRRWRLVLVTWSGSPVFAYQWLRCDGAGGSCASIGGAAAGTYIVQAADVGGTLRVQVTATNGAGSTIATSDPTAVVQSAGGPSGSLGRVTVGSLSVSGGSDYLDASGPYELSVSASVKG